jgi:hypothetical protein
MPHDEHVPDGIETPPFLGTWPRVYMAILGYLAVLITLLYMLTKAFLY